MGGRLLLAILAGLVAGLLSWFHPFEALDNLIYDFANEWNPLPPADDILIIAIDEKSLASIGRWPWPREYHVELLRRLTKAKVEAVAYDVIFSEADNDYPEVDRLLAEAISDNGNVILPVAIGETVIGGRLFRITPVEVLAQAAADVGHVHIPLDGDGIARHLFLKEGLADKQWHHFSVVLARLLGLSFSPLPGVDIPDQGEAGNAQVIQRNYKNLMPFVGGEGSFPTLSFVDIIEGNIGDDALQGKIVFVGAAATGLGDELATPQGKLSGVEMNANVFQALRTGNLMTPMALQKDAMLSFFVVALTVWSFTFFKPGIMLFSALVTMAGAVVFSCLLLAITKVWYSPASIICLVIFVYPFWNWLRLHTVLVFMQQQIVRLERESPVFPDHNVQGKPGFFKKDVAEDSIFRLEKAYLQAQHNRELIAFTLDRQTSAVILCDPHGQCLFANDYARTVLGVASSSNVFSWLEGVVVGGGKSWRKSIQELLATGENTVVEGGLQNPALDVICGASLIQLDQAMVLLVITDVTQLKINEKNTAETLRFLSHDLRAPLTSVLALLESARSGKYGQASDALLDEIERYIRRNLSYAESFVHLARAEHDNDKAMDFCTAYSIVDNAVAQVYHYAIKQGLRFEISECEDDLWLTCNRVHIERCVVNLLDNAIKYSPVNGTITIALASEGGKVSIAISDQGSGIPQDQVPLIFERFKQGASAVSGAGLGLHFVRYMVMAHKGTVAVRPNAPCGTTFEILLPGGSFGASP